MKLFFMDNDEASAGSLIGSVAAFLVIGVVAFVLGKVVDREIQITNSLMGALSISQDAANTIYYLSVIFAFLPFLYAFALWLNYMLTAADESGGGV